MLTGSACSSSQELEHKRHKREERVADKMLEASFMFCTFQLLPECRLQLPGPAQCEKRCFPLPLKCVITTGQAVTHGSCASVSECNSLGVCGRDKTSPRWPTWVLSLTAPSWAGQNKLCLPLQLLSESGAGTGSTKTTSCPFFLPNAHDNGCRIP